MKSFQIVKLIELLRSTNQTHIELPDLISLYESTSRSDLVAESISKVHKTLQHYKPKSQLHLFNESNIARYLIDYVPKVCYGRRFGHTFGLAKYILEQNKNNKNHHITIAFPGIQISTNFIDALKSICSPEQLHSILTTLNIVTNPFKLIQCSEETDTLILADFIDLCNRTAWLDSFGLYIQKDKKIIIVGDFVG